MTAQANALAKPVLKEAKDDVLFVGKLEGVAHGLVTYENSGVGDVVALHVKTSTGNSFKDEIRLTAITVGKPLVFAIPKDVFEKKLVPGATADLDYVVTRVAQVPEHSETLQVHLEP